MTSDHVGGGSNPSLFNTGVNMEKQEYMLMAIKGKFRPPFNKENTVICESVQELGEVIKNFFEDNENDCDLRIVSHS